MTGSPSTHLDAIVDGVREELEARKRTVSFDEIAGRAAANKRVRRIGGRLAAARPGIIAEIKRASPSKGWIARDLDPVATALAYARAGACAISVLTEGRRFGGSLADLEAVSAAVDDTPVLRKDFVLDEYMIAEARAYGADLVLLMVSVLGDRTAGMLETAGRYGLDALVEVHDEAELAIALDAHAGIVGINNRNLKTLAVDLDTSGRLLPMIPPRIVKVVESGITSAVDVRRFASLGADAFLVGETLIRSGDPASEIGRLLSRND
ncbi:MAG TPA: indole-3-glycerol phosphate synthase TrpC [Candidatus Deferrimicrobiaceae bacterium]